MKTTTKTTKPTAEHTQTKATSGVKSTIKKSGCSTTKSGCK